MSADHTFAVNVECTDVAAIVRPVGDVDLSSSPMLRTSLEQAIAQSKPRTIVDLTGVGYMDSSGVATLVEGLQRTRRADSAFVLCSMSDRVLSIFQISRLDAIFTIADTLEAALGTDT